MWPLLVPAADTVIIKLFATTPHTTLLITHNCQKIFMATCLSTISHNWLNLQLGNVLLDDDVHHCCSAAVLLHTCIQITSTRVPPPSSAGISLEISTAESLTDIAAAGEVRRLCLQQSLQHCSMQTLQQCRSWIPPPPPPPPTTGALLQILAQKYFEFDQLVVLVIIKIFKELILFFCSAQCCDVWDCTLC